MGILVYGGSFDPPHQGHLELLRAALEQTGAAAIVVPSHQNPLKAAPGASASDRLALLKLALNGLPAALRRRVQISRFELDKRVVFTWMTLAHLKKLHPGAELGLLLGSDCLQSFTRWRRWKDILRMARLVIGRRPGESAAPPPGAEVLWLEGVFPPLSSTGLREALRAGEDVRLPAGVLQHVRRRGLYDQGIHRWLKARLKPDRYAHVLAVARMSRRLAHIHGLDAQRAGRAALLHDAGRALSLKEMVAYCRRYRVEVPRREEIERRNPLLLHAFVSADIARRRFGVTDEGVLSAVRNHTLGRPGMPALDTLLYVADVASEDRTFAASARVRELAFKDLDRALAAAAEAKLAWVIAQGGWLHPLGVELWNSLLENHA